MVSGQYTECKKKLPADKAGQFAMRRYLVFVMLLVLGTAVSFLTNFDHTFDRRLGKWESRSGGDAPAGQQKEKDQEDEPLTGVWISYLELQEFSKQYQKKEQTQKKEQNYRDFIGDIYDHCVSNGVDHVFVHVRPFSDALYPSQWYPWSKVITGRQGEDPGFDPLDVMIEEAHKRNLSFHAWINPYRVTNDRNISQLSPKSTIYKWITSKQSRNVLYYGGKYYLNPSRRAVQKHIIDGIREIITSYPVDGIHFDDYFYPSFTTDDYNRQFDAYEYSAYKKKAFRQGKIPLTIANWRRRQVGNLILAAHELIRAQNEKNRTNILFGISPVGNPDVLRSDYQYYVDIDKIMNSSRYVDYVCPQIYWGFENPDAPFQETLDQWIRMKKSPDIKLYVGLPAYKVRSETEAAGEPEFRKKSILDRMRESCRKKKTDGIIYYRYADLIRLNGNET